jgi:TonB family protein
MRWFNFSVLLAIFISVIGISAQTEPAKDTAVSDSGVQQNRAVIEAPQAEYPPAFGRSGVSGSVTIKITVDETGKVISATVVSGLEQKEFRDSAVAAALKARFHPRIRDGKPVRIIRTIEYNFIAYEGGDFEKVKLFGMGTIIEILKAFAENPELFAKGFGGIDNLSEMKDDPTYGKHFVELAKFADLTPERRRSEADKAYISLKSALNAKEQWELEAGKHFGAFLGSVGLLIEQNAEAEKITRAFGEGKPKLAPLGEMVKNPPKDVDPLLLSRLTALVDSTILGKSTEEDVQLMSKAVDDLVSSF